MLRLIGIEWAKFRKHRGVMILLLLYALILPALLLIPSSLPGVKEQVGELSSFYMFPNIFKYGGFLASWLIFPIAGFLGVITITSEIQQKTLRQNIISGISRFQFFLGKLGLNLLLAGMITIYFCIVALILGFMNTGSIYASKVMEGLPIVLGLFVQTFAYLSFAQLLGLFFKRTGLTLFMFFIYPLLEIFLRYGIHGKFIQGPSIKYYPFNVFEDLVPLPFADMISSLSREQEFDILIRPSTAFPIALLYIATILALSFFKLKKSDL